MLGRRGVLAVSVTVAVVAAGVGIQILPGGAPPARASGLTPYPDCTALLAHYRGEIRASATPYGFGYGGYGGVIEDSATTAAGAPTATRQSGTVGPGATGTNLQEQGVDEPDVAKLQDGRLVVLARGAVKVLSAETQPRLLGSLRLGGPPAYGGEVLLAGDRALVVVPGFEEDLQLDKGEPTPDQPQRLSSLYLPGTPTTRVFLLDMSSDEPRLLEQATYDAQYVSARLVGDSVRLVTTTSPRPPATQPLAAGPNAEEDALAANRRHADTLQVADVLPQVVRTGSGGEVLQEGNAVDCRQTTRARSPRGASTLLVTTMQPSRGLQATDSTAVTTDGDLVYASQDRLYVATSRWGTVGPVRPLDDTSRPGSAPGAPNADEVTTEIHAFDTSSDTTTRYVGTGSVPGYVLGRWALSEHEGALRVATTRQPPWDGQSAGETSSMVVRFAERDGALVETGRVEGLGRTEQIRAVRYFGDMAAVVTFRQTDPLYLLDLSGTPRVVGELKVPGFSTYLHPVGDGLLLGIGQDADESGQVTGMQLSVFDISDPSSPTLVDRLPIGYGYSPALDDSRAFSYDPDRRLAAFAFSGYDPVSGIGQAPSAIGVAVDEGGQLSEVGRMAGDAAEPPNRVLLDGERVYAVGEAGVVAGEAATMSRTGSLGFGAP